MSAPMGAAPQACDYTLTTNEAWFLQAVAVLPFAERVELLRQRDPASLAPLFAQFVGLANSVVANNREMVDLLGWISGDTHPDGAGRANLPTIFGALQGVKLADGIQQAKACDGCAFRLGTPANHSPVTTCDASFSADCGERFMCHERGLGEDGEPTRLCVGFAQHVQPASRRRAAREAAKRGGAR